MEIFIFIGPVLIYNCVHTSVAEKTFNGLCIFMVSFLFPTVGHYKHLDSLSEHEELCYDTFDYSLNCYRIYLRIW